MPAKSSWLQRIPEIIETLSAMGVPAVDRATCERLFGVRRHRAIDLMQRSGVLHTLQYLGGMQSQNRVKGANMPGDSPILKHRKPPR